MKAILFVAPGLHRNANQEKPGTNRPCTWEELKEMHDSGWVDIQSHTWAHRSIPDWPDPVPIAGVDAIQMQDRTGAPLSLAEDLRRSKQLLETEFNKTVRHLAWPRYRGGQEALRLALSAGYEGLWTGTVPGHPLNKPGQSPLEIVRLSGEFLRRMPGEGRESLLRIMKTRYSAALRKKLLT